MHLVFLSALKQAGKAEFTTTFVSKDCLFNLSLLFSLLSIHFFFTLLEIICKNLHHLVTGAGILIYEILKCDFYPSLLLCTHRYCWLGHNVKHRSCRKLGVFFSVLYIILGGTHCAWCIGKGVHFIPFLKLLTLIRDLFQTISVQVSKLLSVTC